MYRPELVTTLALSVLCLSQAPVTQQPAPLPTDKVMEDFLRDGRIVRTRAAGKGVTGSIRATLTDGELTHDAHIQTIDEAKREFRSIKGVEFNFTDKWQYNVAAYKLDRLLDLQLVPATVERRWRGQPASFTWWVDDVLMDEGERMKKNVTPPNMPCWNEQMQLVRVFDQLIENTDRNLGNLVITKAWRVWAIDHTRAFRRSKIVQKPANLTRVDRRLLQKLATLDLPTLKREMGRYLDEYDMRALLSRRDAIVAQFTAKGESVLFDRQDMSAGCQPTPTLH